MSRKRARTDSWPNSFSRTISHEAQDALKDSMDSNSPLADNEPRGRSRKLPGASRAGEQVAPDDKKSCSAAGTATRLSDQTRRDMRIPDELGLSDEDVHLLQHATQPPPVTAKTLYELDLVCIMGNVNLRVDINFDHDLHFMPVKGKRGDQKKREAQMYWAALALELKIYTYTAQRPSSISQSATKLFWQRLPQMFEALKELLLTLIPEIESESIKHTLDVPLLMQQVEKGVLDIARLARWLANLLKNHCAPMRDTWAEDMVRKIEDGLSRQDTTAIVAGLEKLFSILEAMKLDVANHQIRSFRLVLIEETITFQRNHFQKRVSEGRLDPTSLRRWHEMALQQHYTCNDSTSQDDSVLRFASIVHGLTSELTSADGLSNLPAVFQYDRTRLQQLRIDVQNMINLDLCCSVLSEIIVTSGQSQQTVMEATSEFSSRIFGLLWDDVRSPDQVDEVWQNNTDILALELARAIHVAQGRNINTIMHQEVERIEQCLSDLLHGQYSQYQRTVDKHHEQIEKATMAHAQRFQRMSPYAIAESQKKFRSERDNESSSKLPDLEDIARKLAHIAVLNWAVFSELVYNRESRSVSSAERRSSSFSTRSLPIHTRNRWPSIARPGEHSGSLATASEEDHLRKSP